MVFQFFFLPSTTPISPFLRSLNLATHPLCASLLLLLLHPSLRLSSSFSYVLQTYARPEVVFVKGQGSTLWDAHGNPYLDFTAGIAVNSASSSGLDLNGLPTSEAKAATIAWLEATGAGERKVNFKLRDWLFARQRYWGEPFPIVYPEGSEVRADGWVGLVDADPRNAVPCRVLAPSSAQSAPCPCAVLRPGCPPCPLRPCLPPIPVCHRPQQEPQAIPESQLPLRLPDVDDFKPSGTPDPPLAKVTQWVNTTDAAGRPAKRETSTMPQVVS